MCQTFDPKKIVKAYFDVMDEFIKPIGLAKSKI